MSNNKSFRSRRFSAENGEDLEGSLRGVSLEEFTVVTGHHRMHRNPQCPRSESGEEQSSLASADRQSCREGEQRLVGGTRLLAPTHYGGNNDASSSSCSRASETPGCSSSSSSSASSSSSSTSSSLPMTAQQQKCGGGGGASSSSSSGGGRTDVGNNNSSSSSNDPSFEELLLSGSHNRHYPGVVLDGIKPSSPLPHIVPNIWASPVVDSSTCDRYKVFFLGNRG